jgi:hypothetical protein
VEQRRLVKGVVVGHGAGRDEDGVTTEEDGEVTTARQPLAWVPRRPPFWWW